MIPLDISPAWLPIGDLVLKATLVLAAAAAASVALRQASAALRHLIWTLALCSVLVLPVLSVALPRWQMPILTLAPAANAEQGTTSGGAAPRIDGSAQFTHSPALHRKTSTSAPDATTPREQSGSVFVVDVVWPQPSWQTLLLAAWAAGLFLIVGRMAAGLVAVQWMSRRTERVVDAPWLPLARRLAAHLGVSPRLVFLRSRRATMPMAWGIVRPAVMMPADADEWPADRLRIVLLHELAHVKRRDCLTHLVAQLACALYWFNPLAWMAARQIRTERERACDDLVLAAGTRGSDYANQLLEIARVMRAGRFPAVLAGASLAMAHRSQLEGRLMAILDPRVPRSGLSKMRATAASTVCFAAVIPFAAVEPWTYAEMQVPASQISIAALDQSEVPQPVAPTAPPASVAQSPVPRPAPAPVNQAPVARRRPDEAITWPPAYWPRQPEWRVDPITEGVTAGVTGALEALVDDQNPKPVVAGEEHQSGRSTDPRLVAALTAALKDTDKDVRESALHALVQLRDPAIFEPLVQALKDAAPDVREQAAHGLGQLRDRRAIEPLTGALKDENADVREQAAHALGQLRDRGTVAALTAALKDADADVREQAIFALAQIRDPSTVDAFAGALRDASPDVRQQAAFALGQLRDRRAVEPLISSLKDTDADVRQQAAFALGQIRDRGSVEALVIALKDNNADVREQVAFALGQLRDPRAIDGLTAALKDPNASVRQQAAFALGQLAR